MKTEFETRFLEIDKADIVNRLRELGAEDFGEVKLDEVIFYDKDLKWLDEHRLIRLRNKNGKTVLTYKHHEEQKIGSTKEIEFVVSDFEKAKELLLALGYVCYRTIEKYRHTLKLNGVTFDIDTWPKIPTYIEIEASSEEKIKSAAEALGLEWEKKFEKDARYVFKHYGFDFDKIRTVTFDKFE